MPRSACSFPLRLSTSSSSFSSASKVRLPVVLLCLCLVLLLCAHTTNGQFFTKTAKSIPRMGRRSDSSVHAMSPWLKKTLHQIFALTRNKQVANGAPSSEFTSSSNTEKFKHPLSNSVLEENPHKDDADRDESEELRYRWRESEDSADFDVNRNERREPELVSLLAQFKEANFA